jgi:hypothetical protein
MSEELSKLREISTRLDKSLQDLVIVYEGQKREYTSRDGKKVNWWLCHSDPDGEVAVCYSQDVEFEEHAHDTHEIFILRSGKVEIEMVETSEKIILRHGNDYRCLMHIIPAGAKHIVRYSAGTKVYAILIPRGSGL